MLLPEEKSGVEIFLRHCPAAELGSQRFWKKERRRLRHFAHIAIINPLKIMTPVQLKNATFYDGTAALNNSIEEAARLLGVHYFSVYRLIQRGQLRPCRALRGKLLIPRVELLRLLKIEN